MTFLNPFVLFGLAAAAIPVILHLLNLRKLRIVEFSTLTFLKELQQTKIRRLKLRQLLLLVIRTLLIILIVLAFARPALRGTILGTIGSHAHSTVVFIFDDSFSMSASDEHGEVFKQAKDAANTLINLLKEGDEAFLIKLSDLPQATVDPATHDFGSLRTVVNEIQFSSVRRPIEDAVRLSAKLLFRSNNANKEVYIISDHQRTLFPDNLTQNSNTASPLFSDQVKFFNVQIGAKEAANVTIDSVNVQTMILEKDKPASIYASIRNFSSIPVRDFVVSIFLEGIRAAQKNVHIDSWGSASLEFSVTPKKTGRIKGYVELESDAIEQDNRRYFTLVIPEKINVALISNSPEDIRFPLLALQSGRSDSTESLLNIRQMTMQKFPLLDLNTIDVLTFSNVPSFSRSDIDRIKNFTEQGGGIMLLPGQSMDITNYNSVLLPALGIPPIEGITGSPNQTGSLSFQHIDFDHPLFGTVFENLQPTRKGEQQSVESPHIAVSLKRQTGKRARTIINLSDGTPFLSEHLAGKGTILFYSVAPLMSWSDFPLKGIFVPLLYRSVIYLSPQHEAQRSFITGDEPFFNVRSAAQRETGKQFTLVYPDATEEIIQPIIQSSNRVFPLKHLSMPGFYILKNGEHILSIFAVNVDSREGDNRKIPKDELTGFWKRFGVPPSAVQSFRPGENLQSVILESRFGVELWKYCIGLALLMALLEMIVARDSRKAIQPLST